MSGMQPVGVYATKVRPGEIVPGSMEEGPMFRISMAAIDPDQIPEFGDDMDASKPPRATLKIIRAPGMEESDDESDEDDEDDDSSDEEEVNGGPSDPSKSKKLRAAAVMKELEDAMDDGDSDGGDEEVDIKSAISKLLKGKAKATEDDEESDISDDLEAEETVICTLDPEKHYQQPLDFVVHPDERIFFKVTGTHAIHLTGNYVVPAEGDDDDDEDEDYDYDMPVDEDELELSDDEEDELDGLENPRVMEVDSEEEAPKLVKVSKGKNKRSAAESDDEAANLDDIMAKALKPAQAAAEEPKLSKKQLKKLKKNNGEAAPAESKAEVTPPSKSDKKVQFAKTLEQGPTPSSQDKKPKDGKTGTLGTKEVKGVKMEDKKLGTGRLAKSGDTVGLRYIGKLESGKVFDSNKKGKPFSFKLGGGEVIKGMDIGATGMAIGAERRITIPSHLAYGKGGAGPDIPPNATLTFDLKLLTIK